MEHKLVISERIALVRMLSRAVVIFVESVAGYDEQKRLARCRQQRKQSGNNIISLKYKP
ncbi:MAG: hypothetical protein SPI30_04050 [Prevotella sp.]|nr:hypothetical protein [Prevotella sp.]